MIQTRYPLLLASVSPRRRQLLELLGADFACTAPEVDETSVKAETPQQLVAELSRLKAASAAQKTPHPVTVIGADTVVSADGWALGKPHSQQEAFAMLKSLCGRSHKVFTGVTVQESATGKRATQVCETKVTFASATDQELWEYIQTGDCMDKAGAYGIQGPFARHVAGIEGCYFNVMGLPLHMLYEMLKGF